MKTSSKKLPIIITSIIVFILLNAIALLLAYHFSTNKPKQFDENNVGEIYYQQIDEKHIGETDSGIQYADNEILIVTKDDVSKGKVEKLAKKYDAKIVGRIEQTGDYQLLLSKVHTLYELNQIAKDIENEKIVDSAYANYISEVSENSIDYDINTGNRWNVIIRASLFNDKEWGVEAINAPQAWVVMNVLKKQMNPVKVGLIDGCFDTKHEDLDFVKNFYDDNNNDINIDKENAEDFSAVSHGTHVAGTMAARGDNNEGICGVYPYGKDNLYGVSMLGVNYYNKKQSVVQLKCALSELIFRNVKIINYSMGLEDEYIYIYYGKDEKKKEDNRQNIENRANQLGSFLNRCLDKHYDFVIVTAAGNESNKTYEIDGVNNEKETVHTNRMESKYESEFNAIEFDDFPRVANRVITVGAVDKNYNVCDFSDLSMIYAPGEKIFSTAYGNKYQNTFKQGTKTYGWSGTSMAAPHVSGMAADVWTINNKLDGEQVKQIIIESKLDESKAGYPIVDAYKAVNKALVTKGKGVSLKENNGAVLGWVLDENNEKINNASIKVSGNDQVQTSETDEYGHFEIILPAGEYKLVVESGDMKKEVDVTVKEQEVNYLDWIKLYPSNNNYSWLVEPTIEADDIIVFDESYVPNSDTNARNEKIAKRNKYAVIKRDNKYGFIDYDGKELSEISYQNIFTCAGCGAVDLFNNSVDGVYYLDNELKVQSNQYGCQHGLGGRPSAFAQDPENSRYALVNVENGEVMTEYIFDDIYANVVGKDKVAACKKDGKWGYYDFKGNEILSCKFDSLIQPILYYGNYVDKEYPTKYPIFLPTEGYIAVNKDGGYGYYNTKGEEIIPCGEFEQARPVYDGRAWVKKNGKWGVIKLGDNDEEYDYDFTDYAEDDLKNALVSETGGEPNFWYYDDFDLDGKNEAFAIYGEELDEKNTIYFIDNSSRVFKVKDVKGQQHHYSILEVSDGYKFLNEIMSTGGSSGKGFLYGVKGKDYYEPQVSGNYYAFSNDGDNLTATVSVFGWDGEHKTADGSGHYWIDCPMTFDASTKEFTVDETRATPPD